MALGSCHWLSQVENPAMGRGAKFAEPAGIVLILFVNLSSRNVKFSDSVLLTI